MIIEKKQDESECCCNRHSIRVMRHDSQVSLLCECLVNVSVLSCLLVCRTNGPDVGKKKKKKWTWGWIDWLAFGISGLLDQPDARFHFQFQD